MRRARQRGDALLRVCESPPPGAHRAPTAKSAMNKKASSKSKPQRETSVADLKPALIRRFDRRIMGKGEIDLPCVPTMLEPYMTKLAAMFGALGKPFSDEELAQLRKAIKGELERGYAQSPYSR